jgi:3-deoxy-D-manno-octulosonic-acid transferase
MLLLYRLGIGFYALMAQLLAPFNTKARQFTQGRSNWKAQLPNFDNHDVALFHCASLGEFEQARPVLEAFAVEFPDWKIVLSFFSPSGYEVRKNYPVAHFVTYLPLDTPENAQYFVQTLKPKIALFVKYEFWYHTLKALHNSGCEVISFSAIFRKEQAFFKPYGGFMRQVLGFFNHLFVQDVESVELLKSIGITNTTLAGDSRLDRVAAVANEGKEFPEIEHFKGDSTLIMIGSAWPADTDLLLPVLLTQFPDWKVIIAPHELHESYLIKIEEQSNGSAIRYSDWKANPKEDKQVLIINNIGMLAYLYRYADFAWIGGGFGSGIHNTLEAAAFGIPMGFGPRYKKFKEAVDFIDTGAAFSETDATQLNKQLQHFVANQENRKAAGKIAANYIETHKGATKTIIDYCKQKIR